jgi:Protein of unknown function (DUF1236)
MDFQENAGGFTLVPWNSPEDCYSGEQSRGAANSTLSVGNGAGYLPEEQMRSKLLMMSTAALLAGTLAAAGQSAQPGGGTPQEKEKGVQSNQIPKGAQTGGQTQRSEDRQGQTQRDQDKSKTQGQAQREPDKSKSQTQGQAERDQDKAKSQTQGQTERDQDKSKSQTQGQTERDQDKSKGQTQGQTERDQDKTKNQNQGQIQRDQDRTQQGAREGERGGGSVSVTLSTEQRTRVRETVFKEKNAPRVGKVDFSIREGTVIPRTVRVVEIPDVIVEIHPEWRGFKYFLVNEELVVVDPDTLRIVAVIDV